MALRSRYSTTIIITAVSRTTKHTTHSANLVRRRMSRKFIPCLTSLPSACFPSLPQPDLAKGDIWLAKGTDLNPLHIGLEYPFIRIMQQRYHRRVTQDD